MSSQSLFDTIRDGTWHSLNQLANQLEVQLDKLVNCARSLAKQGIITYDEAAQRIKIISEWVVRLPEDIECSTKAMR